VTSAAEADTDAAGGASSKASSNSSSYSSSSSSSSSYSSSSSSSVPHDAATFDLLDFGSGSAGDAAPDTGSKYSSTWKAVANVPFLSCDSQGSDLDGRPLWETMTHFVGLVDKLLGEDEEVVTHVRGVEPQVTELLPILQIARNRLAWRRRRCL
jgi:hypothetical protein